MRADLLSSRADLDLVGRCVQPLADAGHRVQIRVRVGPGVTAAQMAILHAWLEPIKGAAWTMETGPAAGPGLGAGLIYDLAVNIGSELFVDALLVTQLNRIVGVLRHFRGNQPLPPEMQIIIVCDTEADRDDPDHEGSGREGAAGESSSGQGLANKGSAGEDSADADPGGAGAGADAESVGR